jgi:uncharacterized protein YlxW (UPF0749 family)
MESEVTTFLQVAIIAVLLAGALSAIVVGLVRGVQKKPSHLQAPDLQQQQQLEQLQQSVDAIAVEVERIAEAQRFSAKLLAERADPAALTRSGST